MSLRYALLGFLSTEPASGYSIAQEFSEAMGWFWHASHSQIYPELHRLEEQGWVSGGPPGSGSGRTKRVYRITDEGRAALHTWLDEDVDYPPVRDPERTKLIYLDERPLPTIRRHFEAHQQHYGALLEVYERELARNHARSHPRLRKRLASLADVDPELVVGLKVLALQGNVRRCREEVAWATDALSWLERFEQAEPEAEDAETEDDGP